MSDDGAVHTGHGRGFWTLSVSRRVLLSIGVNPSLNAAMVMYTPDDFPWPRLWPFSIRRSSFGNMVGPLVSSAISMMAGIWEVYAIAGLIQLSLGMQSLPRACPKRGEAGKIESGKLCQRFAKANRFLVCSSLQKMRASQLKKF